MKEVSCMIQEGQTASTMKDALELGIQTILTEYFKSEVEFVWTVVASGSGFTEAKPSASSLVSMPVPADITQERRIAFLSAICEMWASTTNCHVNEVVAVARNET